MHPVKLRNPKAEENYFRWRLRWSDAGKQIHLFDEKALHWIWRNLESSWFLIGYEIADREVDE